MRRNNALLDFSIVCTIKTICKNEIYLNYLIKTKKIFKQKIRKNTFLAFRIVCRKNVDKQGENDEISVIADQSIKKLREGKIR